ncbi:hypothetical protein SprV_0200573900 [Sparganum proliferum]
MPAEICKHGGPQLMDHLTTLFQNMWRQGEVPRDFKDATMVYLYKWNGNRRYCEYHRGLPLLKITGKIFARIFLNRLNNHQEQGLLLQSQCGFHRHRETAEMIFAARQLQEKRREMQTHLPSTSVDLTKVLDSVNPMLMDAYRDKRSGIRIVYRTDSHLPNQQQMYFQSRVSTTTVHELLFRDDCALNATTEGCMQGSMNLFSAAYENFGLIINTEKTVFTHQPPPSTAHNAPQISVNGTHLQISTAAAIAASQRRRPTASNVPTMSTDIRAPTGLTGHLRTNFSSRTAPTTVSPSTSPTPSTNAERPPEPLLPLFFFFLLLLPSLLLLLLLIPSSSTASTSVAVASAMPINTKHNPDTPTIPTAAAAAAAAAATTTTTTTINTSNENLVYNCPHCDRTFTSHIGLVGHLQIHRTETGEPAPGAPTYTRRIHLHCPHCTCAFIHRIGLLGHMRVHENLR